MPVKRRAAKSRRPVDEFLLVEHFYGPGSCLFNGLGYLGPHGDGFWREKSPEVQSAVLAEMRADWEAHWPRVLKGWAERSPQERHHGNRAEPWSQTEFGPPNRAEGDAR